MKKIIALLLCFVLTVSIFSGCGGGETAGAPKIESFSVGYAKADITPTESVPLRGYGDAMERFSEGFLEPMYATCVAFADTDGTKVLLISTDMTNSADAMTKSAREKISAETGIPFSNILFTASHSHSAPDYSQAVPTITNYIAMFIDSVTAGAKAAVADLAPATMETGYTRIDRANTVRHYLLSDGSYQGKAVGSVPKDKLIGHATKVDNLMQVVKFTRPDENKKDVVLVNWCGHPMGVNDDTLYKMAGPNYPGILRQTLEAKYDCEVSFVLSGSGNVNNGSQIAGEVDQKTYVDHGERLAREAADVIDNKLTPGRADKIILNENLWVTPNRKNGNSTVPLYAFTIGDWACVTAPFEIFDTNAMAVRDASPFKMTFYASCANEAHGYLPTPASYSWAITYEAGITKYPQGTAELLQEQLIGQLNTIFAESGIEKVEKGEGYNTPEFVPSSDGTIYMNPAPGQASSATLVQNGFYSITLLKGTSSFKTMLCIDKETADKVIAATQMELVLNESNVIVDVIPK
ncbi:MAG: neutral/alkaline non-lysosomal ceramidase N-terminal domain-containing protein [Oscillospiraceae bacterium]|nr:neutral/alkaline non-lysosomal ceramidase N-terminal domain-containing protein [Oscillospiraceae bacterium]